MPPTTASRGSATNPKGRALAQILVMLPAIVAGAAPEYFSGAITGIWAVFLAGLGAQTWQIGLSFTLFALPAVLMSVWLGGLVDRRGARVVMSSALIALMLLAPINALVVSVPALMLLLLIQGIPVAVGRPVVYGEVVRAVSAAEYARAQGVLQMGLMIAQSGGAIAAGILYGISSNLVFSSVAVICLFSLAAVPRLRSGGPMTTR